MGSIFIYQKPYYTTVDLVFGELANCKYLTFWMRFFKEKVLPPGWLSWMPSSCSWHCLILLYLMVDILSHLSGCWVNKVGKWWIWKCFLKHSNMLKCALSVENNSSIEKMYTSRLLLLNIHLFMFLYQQSRGIEFKFLSASW